MNPKFLKGENNLVKDKDMIGLDRSGEAPDSEIHNE